MVAVAKESQSSTVVFALVDVDGGRYPLGAVTDSRNVLPARGPYCSVAGRMHRLLATTSADVSVVFQLAWYSDAVEDASVEL
jgi:hypothetical protein